MLLWYVGVKLSEVYEAAASAVRDANPQLLDKMTKSAGFIVSCCYNIADYSDNIVLVSVSAVGPVH